LKAETASAAQQKTVDAAKADSQQVASQLKVTMAALEAEKAKPATPQQIVLDASKLIPNLPQPMVIQDAPAPAVGTGPAQPGSAIQQPQQQIVIPAADFKAIQTAEIGCQENAAKLTACTLTAANTATELQAISSQRDEWKMAAKGGTWLHRTLTAAKWIGIGAATGYVAGRVTK
jgi:hypothetical protein